MIKQFATLAALVLALASVGAHAQTRELGSSGVLLDGVAAVVDNGVVLKSELDSALQVVLDSLRQQQAQMPPEQRAPLPPLSVIERQVLDQLIVRRVQLQRASRLGITASDEMLNQAIARVADRLGLSFDQFPAALAAEGIDYAAYRQETREELIIEQLEQGEVISRISITPREMEQCLIRLEAAESGGFDYLVSHILIGLSSSADQTEISDARARAQEVIARIEAGEDFAQLALTFSDGQTALDGGSLGWRQGAQLPTLFADRVIRMQPGQVSEPIQAASGFHIVKLNEVRGAEPVMVDQLRVRHILIPPDAIFDDDAVRQRLIGIREQILGGDDFATIALATSQDAVSAADGGDLGWVMPGSFVPEFEQMLATLEPGDLSQPFQTRFGWHIVEVTDRRSHDTTDETKQLQCANQIRANKAEEDRTLWVRRLRDQAFVDVRL
jgi:peptidyl-prolyl cis-trans isomerase SurA